MSQIANVLTSSIISLGFGFSEKSKNEKLEKELVELGEQKQKELYDKLLVLQSQIERQQLITKTINDNKVQELNKKGNQKRLIQLGVLGVVLIAVFFGFKYMKKWKKT
jgi:hypothetical protein